MHEFPVEPPAARAQTPAQWAVRWHGLVAAALLTASVPVLHLAWHVVGGQPEPLLVTRSQVPAPPVRWAKLADGSWMLAAERYLREASPVVWWLRGSWNELLLRAGVSQCESVHVGQAEWLFLRAEVEADDVRFRAGAEVRRQAFTTVRDRVRAAGAELLVLVVPDKSRIYPEFAYPGGVVSPAKADHYATLLGELRDCGIAAADAATALQAARAANPTELFYYRTDTHWRPLGALAAAQAVAAVVEGGPLAARLSPRHALQLGAHSGRPGLGDLAASLGIGTIEVEAGGGKRHAAALSLTAQRFVEPFDSYSVAPVDPQERLVLDGKDPAASILLVGTSYTDANGLQALMLALGRSIRVVQENGATSLVPMQRALRELADPAKPRPQLVVWEIVERGFLEDGWRNPGF